VRQLADWGANVIKIEAPDEVDTGKGLGGDALGRTSRTSTATSAP
jgi:crotonobetainyl-CoA:carnitine CoA-transferase CaiB-like acyl-CoA transferase